MTASNEPAARGTQRREVYFHGTVQGVGFRYTARRVAAGFAVTGFVRNLSDGRVQLIAEGQAGEIDRSLAALHQRMGRHIDDVEQTTGAATGEFAAFEIR